MSYPHCARAPTYYLMFYMFIINKLCYRGLPLTVDGVKSIVLTPFCLDFAPSIPSLVGRERENKSVITCVLSCSTNLNYTVMVSSLVQ